MMTILAPGAAWPTYGFTPQPKPKQRRQPRAVDKPDSCKTRILAYLSDNPASTVIGTARALGVGYDTADMTLRRLTKAGLVRREQRQISNGIIYVYWRNDEQN